GDVLGFDLDPMFPGVDYIARTERYHSPAAVGVGAAREQQERAGQGLQWSFHRLLLLLRTGPGHVAPGLTAADSARKVTMGPPTMSKNRSTSPADTPETATP